MNEMEFYNDAVMHILEKGRTDGVSALNERERVVYLVAELDTLVNMEGLFGFYSSLGGEAQAVVGALEKIGALESAALIRGANALFPGGCPPEDPTILDSTLDRIMESDGETVNRFESDFLARPDAIEDKLREFVIRNWD